LRGKNGGIELFAIAVSFAFFVRNRGIPRQKTSLEHKTEKIDFPSSFCPHKYRRI